MTDTAATDTSLDALAHQYLDLWQDHVTALAGDPTVSRALSSLFSLYGVTPPDAVPSGLTEAGAQDPIWPPCSPMDMMTAILASANMPTRHGDAAQRGENGNADGTPPASTASGDSSRDVDELLRRIAVLEERISTLESQHAGDTGAQRPAPDESGGGAD